jgi:hypothetical protein
VCPNSLGRGKWQKPTPSLSSTVIEVESALSSSVSAASVGLPGLGVGSFEGAVFGVVSGRSVVSTS